MNLKSLSLLFVLFFTLPCLAKVKKSRTVPVKIPVTNVKTNDWKATIVDMEKNLPTGLTDDDSPTKVVQSIGDKALQSWLDNPEVQSSIMGRTAKGMENAMKTEMSLGSSAPAGAEEVPGQKKIDHRLKFQYQALQAQTKLEYSGWLNAAWNYNSRVGASVVELSEKVWKDKDLTISHTAAQEEDVSAVGLRWSW